MIKITQEYGDVVREGRARVAEAGDGGGRGGRGGGGGAAGRGRGREVASLIA